MNDVRFDSCVEAYLEGCLAEEDRQAFEQELQASAARRARFWALAEVPALVRDAARMSSVRLVEEPVHSAFWRGWGGWGIAAALLVGAVLGMGGAGAVWAVANSMGRAMEVRQVALEDTVRAPDQRVPRFFEGLTTWAGDVAEWAGPPEFSRATLRFLEAAGEGGTQPASSCDLYRIVDLRSLQAQRSLEESVLEFSAEFLDNREEGGDLVRFTARVQLYAGDPEEFVRRWPHSRGEAVSLGSDLIASNGGAPGAWRRVVAHTFVPRQATFALLQVVATRAAQEGPARFEHQYVRAISVKLRSPAKP